jgi:hypothetical protein
MGMLGSTHYLRMLRRSLMYQHAEKAFQLTSR